MLVVHQVEYVLRSHIQQSALSERYVVIMVLSTVQYVQGAPAHRHDHNDISSISTIA